MATYRSIQGDTVDNICHRHYGTSRGTTEAVYAANAGLCELPIVLPPNTLLTLPDITTTTPAPRRISLWD